jgi:hypothetical protein
MVSFYVDSYFKQIEDIIKEEFALSYSSLEIEVTNELRMTKEGLQQKVFASFQINNLWDNEECRHLSRECWVYIPQFIE